MITPQTSKPEPRRAAPRSGLVVAAIGFHLLLCSIASAAGACSDTLDRSARRLPAQMAQVFREIVDRHASARRDSAIRQQGFRLGECPRRLRCGAPVACRKAPGDTLGLSMLSLPPPGAC